MVLRPACAPTSSMHPTPVTNPPHYVCCCCSIHHIRHHPLLQLVAVWPTCATPASGLVDLVNPLTPQTLAGDCPMSSDSNELRTWAPAA
jgi:hypothetical protein